MDTMKPLAGVRVVDFCWVAAGPMATRILANFGAQVIKVESRVHMDSLRYDLRPEGSTSENVSAIFAQVNPGKLSVNLDLSRDKGRDLVRRLIATADVVTNNYRPGALERMGLGYEALREINPGIVLLNMPGCGREGPWSQVATMGNLVLAASGHNSLTGFAGQPPRGLGTPWPDFTSPYIGVATVLAALRERDRTGLGQELDLSQLSATVSLLGVEWMQFVSTGQQPPRRANRDPNHCPHGVYPTSGEDEWCAIAAHGDRDWAELCGLMGRSELRNDDRFATHESRKVHEDEVDTIVSLWTHAHDRWELADLLQAHGIAAAAVEDLRDLLETDPQLVDHFQSVDPQPSDPEVELVIDGESIRFAGVDRPLKRAPMYGEHNEYVLRELVGLTQEQFDWLVVEEVIN